jgi:hypothetical protein
LCREFLFYPVQSLSRSVGSGLCVAREPRLPRTHSRVRRHSLLSQSHAERNKCQENGVILVRHLMRTVRRRLSSLLALVLLMQLGGILAPVALSAAGISVIEACTCPGGNHATTCPMHHSKENRSAGDANRCAMRSASTPTDFALLTLGTGGGVLPSLHALDVPDAPSAAPAASVSTVRSRTDFPDSPPPRR